MTYQDGDPMTTIKVPAPLRLYTNGENAVPVSGATVGAALNDLIRQYPDLQMHLFEGDNLRSFVNIYLNKEDVRHLQGPDTAVTADDTLLIIPSIAGG
jgi:molybdopterin converting factor small subunit